MSLIQFDSKLSKQPSSNARLRDKWTSFSVLSQRGLTVLGDITKDVSIGGRGWQGNGSTKGAYVNASMSIAAAGGSETDSLLIGVIFSSTVTTDGTLVGFGVSTNTTGGYFQITHSGGALLVAADDAANVSGVASSATFGFNDGLVHTAVALLRTRSDGRYQGLWVDGKFFASGTSGVFHATTFDRIAVACLRRNATSGFLPAGRYVYEAFYGKGFSADEAQNLSARRWDAFYAPKRIWVPGSATTPVSATLDLSWVARSGVQQPLALSYAVKNAVQSDLGVSWPVKTSAQQALSLSWLVRQSINQTLGLAYPVLNGVQQSQALAWAVKNAVQQSQALSWTVRAGVQASLAISYTVLNGVQQSQALSWTVRNAVQANLPLAYILRNAVQADLPIGYPITGTTPVSRTLDLSWSVLNSGTVTSQLGLSWIVRAGVQQPLALAYPVKAGVQATRPLSWIVRAGVQQALPLAYSVLTSAQRSQALSWAVKAAAQTTLPLSWIVRSGVQQPLALGYSVKNAVQADRTLGYPVLTAAQSSLLLDYLVRAGVQVSFPLAYQVTNAVSVDLPLAWVVFSSQGVPELLCVSVESAYQFKHLLEDAFEYEGEIAAGFPALRADVKKVTTVCGDC